MGAELSNNVFCLCQVQTYFRANTEYQKNAAFCVKLDRVPNLSSVMKDKIKHYLSNNKNLGINNIPRKFNPPELAAFGKVVD